MAEPIAWMVYRDVDYESRKFFTNEQHAFTDASEGICAAYVVPLYATLPPVGRQTAKEMPLLDVTEADKERARTNVDKGTHFELRMRFCARERQLAEVLSLVIALRVELASKDAKYTAYRDEAVAEYARYEAELAELRASSAGCVNRVKQHEKCLRPSLPAKSGSKQLKEKKC